LTAFPASSAGVENGLPANDGNVFLIGFPTIKGDLTSGQSNCTAVLVTPGHLLTAAHCLNGQHALRDYQALLGNPAADSLGIDTLNPVIRVQNSPNGSSSIVPLPTDISSFQGLPNHTYSTWNTSQVDFTVTTASVTDLAVIPLDKRVPLSAATPAQLPFHNVVQAGAPLENFFVADSCPQSFDARVVGYGGGSLSRNYANVEVTRQLSLLGDIYRKDYVAVTEIPDLTPAVVDLALDKLNLGELTYLGDSALSLLNDILTGDQHLLERGDSGGPVFLGNEVCGINSATGLSFGASVAQLCTGGICISACVPGTDLCVYDFRLTISNRHARVDSNEAVAWLNTLQPPLYDSHHHLFATCGPETPAQFNDKDSDGDFIPDGCDPCPFTVDAGYKNTGIVDDQPDLDHDGVRDDCDSCAPRFDFCADNNQGPDCVAPTFNPREVVDGLWTQRDTDGDGVGDVCDKCPHSDVRRALDPDPGHLVGDFACCSTDADCGDPNGGPNQSGCVPLASHIVGPPGSGLIVNDCPATHMFCSTGLDSDGDHVQNSCDNCTHDANTTQQDTDDDGVGDACDNCNGVHVTDEDRGVALPANDGDKNTLSCSTDFDCAFATGVLNSTCIPGRVFSTPTGFTLENAHCSRLRDDDGDGLGSKCDNCPEVANPKQLNSNLEIEQALLVPYPYRGDGCDPNPTARLMEQIFVGDFDAGNPSAQDLWVTFSYNPQRLPNAMPSCNTVPLGTPCWKKPGVEPDFDPTFTGTPAATVGARFCDCTPAGAGFQNANIEDCRQLGCDLDANEYDDALSKWNVKHPSLIQSNSLTPSLPIHQPTGFPPFLPGLAMEASRDAPVALYPLGPLAPTGGAASFVSWDLSQDGASSPALYHFGKNGVYWGAVRSVPQMSADANGKFTAYSNTYRATFFGQANIPDVIGYPLGSCFPGNCGDPCFDCRYWVDAINLIVQPSQTIIAQGIQHSVDVTSAFSTSALALLTQPGVQWTRAAEASVYLQPGDFGLVSVSPDGTTVDAALAKVGAEIQPVVRSTRGGPAGQAAIAATEPDPIGPRARTQHGVVLSAREPGVFVIGGTLDNGEFAQDIWFFDLVHKEWVALNIVGPTPRNVLAATYLPTTRSLYFVDESASGWFHHARLMRYDIRTRAMTVLGAWPRTQLIDRVELSGSADGTLVLAGSSSKLKFVLGVVVDPGVQPLKVEAAFFEQGVLVLPPTLSGRGLTLPLARSAGSGVKNTFIPNGELFPSPTPKKGKGKAWGKKPMSIGDCL
jgi:Thrombospondin type 3 repeat